MHLSSLYFHHANHTSKVMHILRKPFCMEMQIWASGNKNKYIETRGFKDTEQHTLSAISPLTYLRLFLTNCNPWSFCIRSSSCRIPNWDNQVQLWRKTSCLNLRNVKINTRKTCFGGKGRGIFRKCLSEKIKIDTRTNKSKGEEDGEKMGGTKNILSNDSRTSRVRLWEISDLGIRPKVLYVYTELKQ